MKKGKMAEIIEHLHACETLSALLPSQVKELAVHATMRSVPKNTDVFIPGDAADSVYLQVFGSGQITHADKSGKRAILQVIWPGKLIGHCALIDVRVRESRCTMTSDSLIIVIPVSSLKKAMSENPGLTSDLLQDIGNTMRSLAHRLASVLLRPKRQRLLDVLSDLANSNGVEHENALLIPQVFSHQQLSEMIGASRETVSIILGQLKAEGIVAYNGRRIMMMAQPESSSDG